MFDKKLNLAVPGLDSVVLPKMVRVKQRLDDVRVADIEGELRKSIGALPDIESVRGKRIAITAGSRGVAEIALIIKTVAGTLKERGAHPFIIPAMGSHGGGTPEGQARIIADYGITEATMGVPVVSSMDVVEVAKLPDGMPVYCDKAAWEADGIVIVNRVKPHTMFKGDIESGLLKMCAIGIGKHIGAATYHRRGFKAFPTLIPEAGMAFLGACKNAGKFVFGVASVENGHKKVKIVEAIAPEKIFERERELLKISENSMARLPFDEIDVLVIEEFGKNISGNGMDPNVTGRGEPGTRFEGTPSIETIVVLGLTEETHGNATGIGGADIITRDVTNAIDFEATYINHITSGALRFASVPLIAHDEDEALRIAYMSAPTRKGGPRFVRIKNTLELEEIWVSENMMGSLTPPRFF